MFVNSFCESYAMVGGDSLKLGFPRLPPEEAVSPPLGGEAMASARLAAIGRNPGWMDAWTNRRERRTGAWRCRGGGGGNAPL